MISILEFKEKLKSFYAKYGRYVDMAAKFVVALVSMLLINKNLGYMTKLDNPFLIIIVALVCSVLPYGLIAVILGACLIAQIYAVSMEMAILVAIILLVVAILYYGFHPKDAHILILTPLMFALKIPYAVPLVAGLSAGITTIVPVSCGIFLYYIIVFIKNNAGLLTNDNTMEITSRYKQLLNGIITNKQMWLIIITFAVALLIVFLIRQLSVNYSWYIAIAFGIVIMLLGIFIGQTMYDIETPMIVTIIEIVLSALIALIYTFFAFNVDYTRAEITQFEDDDYCYYVKAVPKVKVQTTGKKVRKFTEKKSSD